MDVDTALSEVPVNLFPLIDDTDFKTIEGAVAYNAAGMALRWHFVTTAGAYTVTSVTPTTGGAYDWTDQGDSGIYTIEIPASGGASINNDTEGFGWFTGFCTGVLPWRGPVVGFRAAALNDALIDGGDLLDVSVTQFAGSAITAAAGIPEVKVASLAANAITATAIAADAITDAKVASDVTIASVTGAVGSVTGAVGSVTGAVGSVTGAVGSVTAGVTVTTNNDKTGYTLSAAGIQAVWDALMSALTTVGSVGKLLADNLNATVSSRLPTASYVTGLDAAATRAALGLASANLDTQLSAIDDFLDTEVAAILAAVDTEVAAILALLDDPRTEPGQVAPPVNPDMATKVDYLYKSWRNKKTNDGTVTNLFADDATTVDQKQATSEAAGTVTKGEWAVGP